MRHILTILSFLLVCASLTAQNLRIAEFKLLERDLTACMNPVNDINGRPCALVKIQTLDEVTKVEGSPIKVVENGNETWAYFPPGQKLFRVLTRHHKPLFIDITGYEKKGLVSKATYLLDLESDLPLEILFGIAPAQVSQPQAQAETPVSPQSSAPTSVKRAAIGVFDETRIAENYPGYNEKKKSVEERSARYETEFQNLKSELENKYNDFQKLDKSTPKAISDSRIQEIQDLDKKINQFRETAQADLNRMWEPFQKEFQEKGGIAIAVIKAVQVLDSTQTATESRRPDADYVDITDNIIALLNGHYTLPFDVNIGYYDPSRTINTHPAVVSAQKELEELTAGYEAEFNRIKTRFDRSCNEFQQMDESVPQEVKERKIQEIQAIEKESNKYREDATEALRVRQEELLRPLREKCEAAISDISARKGLIHTQESQAARLMNPRIHYIDITSELQSLIQ